jgi:hypothetical protein
MQTIICCLILLDNLWDEPLRYAINATFALLLLESTNTVKQQQTITNFVANM